MLDVDKLIAPVSDDEPSGSNLEYEPEFGELERTALGKAEHVMGDEVVAAEEPDWGAVLKLSKELLEKTKDLRVVLNLTRAALNKHGPQGLADGVRLIRLYVEEFWDSLHPQLDAEDNDDPTFRVNSLLPLVDREGLLRDLLTMTLVNSRLAGRFNLRDIRVAAGELQPLSDQENVPDSALINEAFLECDLDELQADAAAIDEVIEDIGKIESIFVDKVGAGNSPDLEAFIADIKDLRNVFTEKLVARGVGVEIHEEGSAPGAAAAQAISGEVNSREDAIRMIDKICSYFERSEPSSPVPMLLQRAKRLVSKDFLEIMRDLTPDAVSQAEQIGGISSSSDDY